MKLLIVIAGLAAVVAATPLAGKTFKRHYDPREEIEDRSPYFLWEDKEGKLHVEDLTIKPDITRKASTSDITIYLYTRDNRDEPDVIKLDEISKLLNSHFDKKKKNVFLIHGWNNDHASAINTELTKALLTVYNINVFVIDWSTPANKFYTTAKSAVPIIGSSLGNFINEMITELKISSKQISIIGHSLGAHVAGCAGARVEPKLDYIIGLDPASPLFTMKNIDNRLDPTDADFVQIIHTNGGLLGFSSAIGDADYYPNGGSRQPGCGLDIAGTCAHSRSYLYLAESIYASEFSAHLCDSFKQYDKGNCYDNHESFLGGFAIDKRANGDYYLVTGDNEPYAVTE